MRSPRACLIASAASTRSWSAPSGITRSTARVSCSPIWARLSAGTAGSPRRSSATRRSALAMARSPPFTATYISDLHAHRARQHGDRLGGREHDVDAAGIKRGVPAPLLPEAGGDSVDAERGLAGNARPAEANALAVGEARHLDDDRAGALGRLG